MNSACASPLAAEPGYVRAFNRRAADLQVPLSGSIDLTHRCNLDCIHCYLGARNERGRDRGEELGTNRMLELVDEIADAGCLFLLLTGGEPLLRPDFPAIYRRAKERGLLVTVFTNGTLVDEGIVELFRDLPPHLVEVSVYGSTAATFERVTGVAGSHERCVRGIDALLAGGVRVGIKTILMTVNRHEFEEIERFAAGRGARFRFDAAVFPRADGDRAPVSLRVTPREAVERELSDPARQEAWAAYYARVRGGRVSEKLYNCGAGSTGFHVDPFGALQPCIMTNHIASDLRLGDFDTGWRSIAGRIAGKLATASSACRACEKVHLCGFCPGYFSWENGAEETRSEFLCAMGHQRFQVLNNVTAEVE